MKQKIIKVFIDLLIVIIGCSISAFAITSILKPNGLITGGITGISLLFGKILNFDYTIIYYSLSILILIITRIVLGKKEALKIIIISLLFPLILIFFENFKFKFIEGDLLLASIYYAVIGGAGVGLILRRGFSFGGTDTIAKILHRKVFSFISISQILLVIDLLIIIGSAFIYGRIIALYSIINTFIAIKVIDIFIFGLGMKKVKIEIISKNEELISGYIINNIKRGFSIYHITGGYTNETKQKIVCICTPRESMLLRRFIANVDSSAFIDVLPVVSVWGDGLGFDRLVED